MSVWDTGARHYAGAFALFTQYFSSRVAVQLCEAVRARGGGALTVMDAAAGTGASTFPLRRALHEQKLPAQIIATDISAGMLKQLEDQVAKDTQDGINDTHPITTAVMDLNTLEQQPDASLDALLCVFGIMFVGDGNAAKAAAAIHRVLKPGARAHVITWMELGHNELLAEGGLATGTLTEEGRANFMAGMLQYGKRDYAQEFMVAGGFAVEDLSFEHLSNENDPEGERAVSLTGIVAMLNTNPVIAPICKWDEEGMRAHLLKHCVTRDESGEPLMPLRGTALVITARKA